MAYSFWTFWQLHTGFFLSQWTGAGSRVGARKGVSFTFSPSPVLSAMIRGAADGSRVQVWDYEEGEVETMLDRYFDAYLPQGTASSSNPSA